MSQAPAATFRIPTDSPQPAPGRPRRAKPSGRPKKASGTTQALVLAKGAGRTATRGGGEVVELECGITVFPARTEGGRWRAVWYEDGRGSSARRQPGRSSTRSCRRSRSDRDRVDGNRQRHVHEQG